MDEHERASWDDDGRDDDGREIIGGFATIAEALDFAIKDAAWDDSAYCTTFYADCGHHEIPAGVDPDGGDTRS